MKLDVHNQNFDKNIMKLKPKYCQNIGNIAKKKIWYD